MQKLPLLSQKQCNNDSIKERRPALNALNWIEYESQLQIYQYFYKRLTCRGMNDAITFIECCLGVTVLK